jgi:hypothetical protein
MVETMTEVQSAPTGQTSHPQTVPERISGPQIPAPSAISMPTQSAATKTRNGHLNLDTFSPVNQNGSFEFDRVLKSGYVEKRTRKTKVPLRPYNDLNKDLIRPIDMETDLSRTTTEPPFHL